MLPGHVQVDRKGRCPGGDGGPGAGDHRCGAEGAESYHRWSRRDDCGRHAADGGQARRHDGQPHYYGA